MKQLKKYWMLLVAIVFSSGITGCSNEEDTSNTPTGNPKEYTVTLGFSGEITDITESPLRDTANDLYGIQVYSSPAQKDEYKPYAYGLFDNKAGMIIKLLEGYKYKFESTMVVDGKNRMDDRNGRYAQPFYWNSNSTPISNKFIYAPDIINNGLAWGLTSLKTGGYNLPNIERYHGVTMDYIPSENATVSIDMRKVFFGAKFIVEGLNSGSLLINMEDAPSMTIEHPATEVEDHFTFKHLSTNSIDWTQDSYSEDVPVIITWDKGDGVVVPVASQTIIFKRNKLTTITVQIKEESSEEGVDISEEDTPMQPGDNITL